MDYEVEFPTGRTVEVVMSQAQAAVLPSFADGGGGREASILPPLNYSGSLADWSDEVGVVVDVVVEAIPEAVERLRAGRHRSVPGADLPDLIERLSSAHE